MKSKGIAIVLALFLGGFGAHNYYLGKTVKGVLCSVFFWTFIPSILAVVDIILIALMPDEKFNQVYNK